MSADTNHTEAPENKTVEGDSVVGNVNSNEDQFKLDNSNGNANPNDGAVVSVRQIVLLNAFAPAAKHTAYFGRLGLQLVQSRFVGQFLIQHNPQLKLNNFYLGSSFYEIHSCVISARVWPL